MHTVSGSKSPRDTQSVIPVWDFPVGTALAALPRVAVCCCLFGSVPAGTLLRQLLAWFPCVLVVMLWCHCCPLRRPLVVGRRCAWLGRPPHRPPLDLLQRHFHGRCLCGVCRSPASLGCCPLSMSEHRFSAPLLKPLQRYNHCLVFGPLCQSRKSTVGGTSEFAWSCV